LDERVVNYLLGIRYVDKVLDGLTELFRPQPKELPTKSHKEEKVEKVEKSADISSFRTLRSNLVKYLEDKFNVSSDTIKGNSKATLTSLISLIGKDGCGRMTLIKSVLRDLGFPSPLLILDLSLAKGVSASIDEVFAALKIEALLLDASLYIDNFSALSIEEDDIKNMRTRQKVLWHLSQVSNNDRLIFIAATNEMDSDPITPSSHFFKINSLQVKVPDLTVQDREYLWKFFLQRFGLTFKDDNKEDEVKQVASKFNFTVGQIKDAILTAINISKYSNSRSQPTTRILVEDLYHACFHVSNRKLGKVSVKMDKDFLLTDIILPPDKKIQLEDIINFVKNKIKVFSEWGFQAKMGLGSGLNILFSGESGTGKTMAAQVIANELRMEIFKIDLSLLISKYIGETEKNINRVFQEAKTSNALIFFDEADAIFGKRSEIKDAHDRYANIEVSYLLQKLEEHNEIVILASNLKHNIDDAFIRRMHFVVEFPFPNERERLEIWKHVFPEPFTHFLNMDSINLDFLAGQFKTSGAMIKNIALSAAFLAAAESSKIEMKHLVTATKRELEKKGKPILKADFGIYYDLG
jgi:AAA+ superfamily predicted ATPase